MKLLFVPPYCRCHYRSLSCVDVLRIERSDVTIFLISFLAVTSRFRLLAPYTDEILDVDTSKATLD